MVALCHSWGEGAGTCLHCGTAGALPGTPSLTAGGLASWAVSPPVRAAMSLSSDEVNFLVYRYLLEAGQSWVLAAGRQASQDVGGVGLPALRAITQLSFQDILAYRLTGCSQGISGLMQNFVCAYLAYEVQCTSGAHWDKRGSPCQLTPGAKEWQPQQPFSMALCEVDPRGPHMGRPLVVPTHPPVRHLDPALRLLQASRMPRLCLVARAT